MTTDTQDPPKSDQQQALDELNEAAKIAQESLQHDPVLARQFGGGETFNPAALQDEAAIEAARRERMISRAKRQRERGREEMGRQYDGVMVVDRELEVFDPAIASSVTRFMALTDRTVHLLNRRGERFLETQQVDRILEAIESKISLYVKTGAEAKKFASQLVEKYSPAEYMWLNPRYTTSTLKHSFQIKTRLVVSLSDGAHDWDEAIRLMCELEFNGKVKSSEIAEVRRKERSLFSNLNYFCIQTILNMYRGSMPKELNEVNAIEEVQS